MANVSSDVIRNPPRDDRAADLRRQPSSCQSVATAIGVNPDRLLEALKRSWDGMQFRCYHTGLPLTTSDSWNPLYLTLENRSAAGVQETIVVAAVVQGLASQLPGVAFQEVCRALRVRMGDGQRASWRNMPIRRRLRASRLSKSRTRRAGGP